MQFLAYFQFCQNIGMLGMKIGGFEDKEHDKAGFNKLRPLCRRLEGPVSSPEGQERDS